MEFSDFAEKLASHSGILQLMDDISRPFAEGMKVFPLGGGNPARVSGVEKEYRKEMERLLSSGDDFENFIAHYDSPQGRVEFLQTVSGFFSSRYGWNIDENNVALTNGSQSAMFYIFNMFSGRTEGKKKTILFPLMPEYIGYADQAIEKGTFVSIPSKVEYYSDRSMKYVLDQKACQDYLASHDEVGAIAVSRPTNPSGNVLTDSEIGFLSSLAEQYDIPLVIDNAYGLPFPDIVFTDDATPVWNEHIILSMSLSKIGLPSIRTGIVIASREIASKIGNMNAICALATGSFGPVLVDNMLKSGRLVSLAESAVRPFYKEKSEKMLSYIHKYFRGTEYYVHKIEGSIFSWLYLPSLTVSALEFYRILMDCGVVTVPSEYFFFGSENGKYPHEHYDKCLRLNYSGDDALVEEGVYKISLKYREYS